MKELLDKSSAIEIVPKPTSTEVLLRIEHVSKKLCKDLKKSLWYGVRDFTNEMIGRRRKTKLRDKEFWAVNDVSFELRRGQCLGLMGQNGAGKSTLLKMINGLIKPDKGKITLYGRVGALIELNAGFNPILTGRENTYINGAILGFSKEEIDKKFEAILEFSEIGEFIDSPVQNYSSGMKVRLGFAIASHLEPDILLIDEVLAVGDVGFRAKCLTKLKSMMSSCCIVFVSHIPSYTEEICSHILLLEKGCNVFAGTDVKQGLEQYDFYNMNEEEQVEYLKKKERLLNEERLSSIELTSYKLKNSNTDKSFPRFTPIELTLAFKYNKDYERSIFGFSFTNSKEQNVLASRSKLYKDSRSKGDEIKLDVKFENILLPSKYFLNIHFIGITQQQIIEGKKRYDHVFVKKIENINVTGTQYLGDSPVQIVADWKVIN